MKAQKKRPQPNAVRIIGGQWRGRKLPVSQIEGLRPTGDRTRETLFNWLQLEIADLTCLDLFAGTAALGLEALSRGAKSVIALEKSAAACRQIEANRRLLDADLECHCTDALVWLEQPVTRTFDLAFVDPPFQANLWQPATARLVENGWMNPSAWIYVEQPVKQALLSIESFELFRQKTMGQVTACLYRREG